VAIELHQWTADLYLLASIAAVIGLGGRARRLLDVAILLLACGAVVHGVGFWQLHDLDPTPPLTDLPLAVSLTAWIGTVVYLLLLLRVRLRGLAVLVAPLSFFGAFFASLTIGVPAENVLAHPVWSHLHVVLASGGVALAGVSAAAGVLWLAHHRSIKAKRPGAAHSALPSLETLDRVNVAALSVSFLLLTLGLLTGVAWVYAAEGRFWPEGWHANATLACWMVYATAVAARFGARQGARISALSSAAAFGLLLIVVIGVRAAS
jgi:ABC-type transport system involved in cytochrome c biogenesis permease subunit